MIMLCLQALFRKPNQGWSFQKLDKSELSNLGNLDPEVLSKIDAHDPGGQYSVNYMYGTTGIGYNTDKVDEMKLLVGAFCLIQLTASNMKIVE